ncbi:heterokaryon incompatibility protein-domain-containing protein [Phascolomyces articulosus]|uniref:Heterokaryon incompatibility protein-domain-containing protein n=1 Tax=Phascolomyces articulosus TaxID=60185 RepID=A0AAD5PCL5_9FUNG|nr:heterokaryon incompatibility protein-domain-containing protein [Phascolomyces articulosus]
MGYITYHRTQWRVENTFTGELSGPYKRPPIRDKFPAQQQDKPLFLPSKLVRVSDMTVIKGSEIGDGKRYCAISYSWNQSGNIVKKKKDCSNDDDDGDECTCDDEGKHVIVDYPSKKVKIKGRPRGRRRFSLPGRTRLVEFKDLIQQICLDFGVEYLWFDKMCINQEDPEEKRREIQQMYRIYQNALFTIALIPELLAKKRPPLVDTLHNRNYSKSNNSNDNSATSNNSKSNSNSHSTKYTYRINTNFGIYTEWARRVWCLEELAKSSLLLYVAGNGHMWSDIVDSNNTTSSMPTYHHHYMFSICVKSLKWAACTTLYHAHRRLSTKAHDRIFSLANIYPDETMDKISFTYNQPILELMNQFYRALAKCDIRIMLFGVNYKMDNFGMKFREKYATGLPSWVGMTNTHLLQLSLYDLLPLVQTSPSSSSLLPFEYSVNDESYALRIKCRYIPGTTLLPNKKQQLQQTSQAVNQGRNKSENHTCTNTNNNNNNKYKGSRKCKRKQPLPYIPSLPIYSSSMIPKPLSNETAINKETTPFSLPFSVVPEPPVDDDSFESLSYPGYYGIKVTHELLRSRVEDWIPKNIALSLDNDNIGYLSLTDSSCTDFIILSELAFTTIFPDLVVMPIVTKKGLSKEGMHGDYYYYNNIGVCFMHKFLCESLNDLDMKQQFVIQ